MLQASGRSHGFALSLLLLGAFVGCVSVRNQGTWGSPSLVSPDAAAANNDVTVGYHCSNLVRAEWEYAKAFEVMACNNSECVDHFFHAASFAWLDMEQQVSEGNPFVGRAGEIYRSSLIALIDEGQRYQRLDPSRGLRIQTADGWSVIPMVFHGFPRADKDFHELISVGEYCTKQLNTLHQCDGLGVPAIAVHHREPSECFQRKQQPFAATLVLRTTPGGPEGQPTSTTLELYDPLRTSTATVCGRPVPLANDISAPIARALSTTTRNYVQEFLRPGSTPDEPGLFMLEPFQPGKIPIVFVHGLLSDRLTWANVANEIQSRPELMERYQLWGFEYPTGGPFLKSATLLRRQLEQLRVHFDPQRTDCALTQVVLVGHSLGGLISKLQVTHSGVCLWKGISNRPFENIIMDQSTRVELGESLFFEPSPMIARVIFMGTPHRGSAWAQRPIGRIGSLLVEEPAIAKAAHQQLLRDNPGAFSREFTRRVPTSVDLLQPMSPLLKAVDSLPIDSRVVFDSIIGNGHWMLGNGDSDGVVPVSSAHIDGAASETFVQARHSKIPQDPAAIEALCRILQIQFSEANLGRSQSPVQFK